MANLIFQNSQGRERIIAQVHNYQDITNEIDKFIADANDKWPNKKPFKIYYIRTYNEDGRAKFDVGSHTEFFFLDQEWPINNNINEVYLV